MWGDYDDRERMEAQLEQDLAFEINCSDCGSVYLNTEDGPCPNCGGSSCSYNGNDAARWNRAFPR
jgi:rRNA maturation endonuclease Nob1